MSQQTLERESPAAEIAAAFVAAQAFRRSELRIRAAYLREFMQLWPILNKATTADDVRRWLDLNKSLIRRWQQPSQSLALEFYRSTHLAQTGRVATVTPPKRMPDEQIVRNLLGRGPGVLRRARLRGLEELEAEERAQTAAAGSGGRMVMAAGRNALEAQQAVGFMRVTDGDPCYWCAMIASRGAVFQSEGTAGRDANDRFIGDGMHKYHDHCGCSVLPIFSRSDFMSEEAMRYRELWNRTGANLSGSDAVNAFRRAYEGRN